MKKRRVQLRRFFEVQIEFQSEGHVVEGRITLESVVNVALVDRKLSKKKELSSVKVESINRMFE